MIYLLSFIYRKTGYFCPLIQIYEYNHLYKQFPILTKRYCKQRGKYKLSFQTLISIEIGMWQVQHGFVR